MSVSQRGSASLYGPFNGRERLEALNLIRTDENGYRLALSVQTTPERRDPVVPTVLEENQTLIVTTYNWSFHLSYSSTDHFE